MELLKRTLDSIGVPDEESMRLAQRRLDSLTKPPGSLGVLEDVVRRVAGITGREMPEYERRIIFTLAADHGVTAEGVSAFPSEVTAQMVANFLNGGAAINVLGRHAGAKIVVVDVGIACEIPAHPDLVVKKVGMGTANMAAGPAMSREQAVRAVEAGIEVVAERTAEGLDLAGTGDMGIGNTTSSAAIVAAFTSLPVEEIAGRGTGLDDAGLERKIEVVRRALKVNRPDPLDALDVLMKVGGFEIGAIAGVILGCAARRVPVVIDGFISGAGALIAAGLSPRVKDFMLASHRSAERGHGVILERLGLRPLFDLDLRLGEGTGAALAISVIVAALKIQREMATFESAGVSSKSD